MALFKRRLFSSKGCLAPSRGIQNRERQPGRRATRWMWRSRHYVVHTPRLPSVRRSQSVDRAAAQRIWRDVNIDDDAELTRRYGTDIPVVFIGARKAAKHRVDPVKFRRQLSDAV